MGSREGCGGASARFHRTVVIRELAGARLEHNLKDGWARCVLGRFYYERNIDTDQVTANSLFAAACRYHFQSLGCGSAGSKRD